jgi:hypothetical protein
MRILISVVASVVLACGDSNGGRDATVPDATADADASEAETSDPCCPIAEAPSCDCFQLGGSVVDGCHALCDAPPVGWTRSTDDNGCPIWVGGGAGSCLGDPDVIDVIEVDGGEEVVEPDTSADADTVPVDDADTVPVDDADTTPPPDASDDVPETEDDVSQPSDDVALRFELAGSIQVIEQYSGGLGAVAGSWIYVDLGDRPDPMLYRFEHGDGACKVWSLATTSCGAGCDLGELCDVDASCRPMAAPISAGDITFGGLVTAITAKSSGGLYTLDPEPPADGLFAPGASITVSAEGAALPAFTATVSGVADLRIQGSGLVELADQKQTVLSWAPAGDGSEVEAILQLGWHGAPATGIIACRAPDSAGEIVVSPDIIQRFPYFGGIGLFQVPSWIERVSRAIVETPAGPIEVTASSRVNLGVTHAEP